MKETKKPSCKTPKPLGKQSRVRVIQMSITGFVQILDAEGRSKGIQNAQFEVAEVDFGQTLEAIAKQMEREAKRKFLPVEDKK